MVRAVIAHLDDVGCARGSIMAFDRLTRLGLVGSGSALVPSPLFPEVVELTRRRPDLDLGVHLALTSESTRLRWGPVSIGSHRKALTDGTGSFWPTTAAVRSRAGPEAVAVELRAQIEAALAAGIGVTHLDHHMGAAVAPEFVAVTAGLAIEFGLPMLLPIDLARYCAELRMGEVDLEPAVAARATLAEAGLLLADHFRIGYEHQDRPCRQVYEGLLADLDPGVTLLSLHRSAPGDIEQVHPGSAAWRIAEYEVFSDAGFRHWVAGQGIEVLGARR